MRKNHIPLTPQEYLSLAYMGSDEDVTPDNLTGEQLAALPEVIRSQIKR
jgi:hypothetical protein